MGRAVVADLLDAGFPVRAMSRHPWHAQFPPGVKTVVGDLSDPSTLDAALSGADQLVLIAVPETVVEVVARAARAAIAAAIGDSIAVEEATPEDAQSFYRAQGGFAAANADFLFGFESYDGIEGATDEPHDTSVDLDDTYLTLTQVTGRPARSYASWARDDAADLR